MANTRLPVGIVRAIRAKSSHELALDIELNGRRLRNLTEANTPNWSKRTREATRRRIQAETDFCQKVLTEREQSGRPFAHLGWIEIKD